MAKAIFIFYYRPRPNSPRRIVAIKSEKDFQLVLDLNVIQTDDGFTAEVPSIKGCESWAHSEEEAINKTVELLRYYLHSSSNQKMIIDRARKEHPLTVYKLVFDK